MQTKKKIGLILFLIFILGLIIGVYYYTKPKVYASITWPASTLVEVAFGGSYLLTLNEKFDAFNGKWPKGTSFYIDQNKIKEIDVKDDFIFLAFNFKKGAFIEATYDTGEPLLKLRLRATHKIDGLEITGECYLNFTNSVLYSAYCPKFGEIKFR